MSFLNKSRFRSKSSLVKPVAIIIAILLIIGGSYVLFGKKSSDSADKKSDENKVEINSSGLDSGDSVDNVGDVEKVIAKWIEANPKAILSSVSNMQRKAAEQQMKDAQKNIGGKTEELFKNPNSPTHAPKGADVTIVEFFDYSCGYCKKVQPIVSQLINEDKKVKVVYKEYPILGAASAEMSQVAIAVNLSEPAHYQKFHEALMKSNAHSKDEAIKIAKSVGVNSEKLEKTLKNDADKINKILQDNAALGASIGINGTPAFIIGEELIPGAADLATMKEKIANIRSKK